MLFLLIAAFAAPTRVVWLGEGDAPDALADQLDEPITVVPAIDLDQRARFAEAWDPDRPDPFPALAERAAWLAPRGAPCNAWSEREWAEERARLDAANDRVFLDSDEDRAALFAHLLQEGRAAENANDPRNDSYGRLEGDLVNLPWARAGLMARRDDGLLESEKDPILADSARYYHDQLDVAEVVDLRGLDATSVIVSGHEVAVPDDGLLPWDSPWRDLVVVREDGFGPAQHHRPGDSKGTVASRAAFRVATWNLPDTLHRREPVVLDGEAAECLRAYDALHPDAHILLALPRGRKKARLWTWDSDTKTATPL